MVAKHWAIHSGPFDNPVSSSSDPELKDSSLIEARLLIKRSLNSSAFVEVSPKNTIASETAWHIAPQSLPERTKLSSASAITLSASSAMVSSVKSAVLMFIRILEISWNELNSPSFGEVPRKFFSSHRVMICANLLMINEIHRLRILKNEKKSLHCSFVWLSTDVMTMR